MTAAINRPHIRIDDLTSPAVISLLREHVTAMAGASPPESCHALDLEGLKQPGVTVWTIWQGDELAGCGALKDLGDHHAEIKSMRTASAFLRQGIASRILSHLISEAKSRGYRRLSLETGSMPFFEPAVRLYRKYGFEPCGPFASYVEDPNSLFMTRLI